MGHRKTPFLPDFMTTRSTVFTPPWAAEMHGAVPAQAVESPAASVFTPFSEPSPELSPQFSIDQPLVLRGGECIIPFQGVHTMDIRIENGKIFAIGESVSTDNARVVEINGKYVAPGVVDPHVHLGIFSDFNVELVTETRSALLNGVTTLGLYLNAEGSYLPLLDDYIAAINAKSNCDIFVHLAIMNQTQLQEIPVYHSRYGINSFKTWMCGIPGLIPDVEDDFLLDLMAAVAALPGRPVLNVHAENHRAVSRATAHQKKADPHITSLASWEKSHPGFGEAEAIQRAAFLAGQSGVQVYFVHLSAKESVDVARRLKPGSGNLFFESTSPYLTLSLADDLNYLNKMIPPIRYPEDQAELWKGLEENIIDTIGTDHTPMTVDEKKQGPGLWDFPPGYPAVGTHLPSLLNKARMECFPLEKLFEKISAVPARIFGLYPKKGSLLPGADADLVIIDPFVEKKASPEIAGSRSDYCLHQGKTLAGWPVGIVKSGRIISRKQDLDSPDKSAGGVYLKR
ncbi:MAG: amidohydrolase family protein [Desulfobacteraceae bacterium]|nr:amidohydrolase family protein [Desulfobacteraceae bacterium]